MGSILAGPLIGASFNASSWLVDWADNGGIILLVHERLYLRRSSDLDQAACRKLDRLRGAILGAGGVPAVADVLLKRRNGDVQ